MNLMDRIRLWFIKISLPTGRHRETGRRSPKHGSHPFVRHESD